MGNKLSRVLTIITGVGCKKARKIYHGGETCECIEINKEKYKLNIGAATAKEIAGHGGKILMIGRDEENLSHIREYIHKKIKCDLANILYEKLDLLNEKSVNKIVSLVPRKYPVWLVHSVGLGAQAYNLVGDNPYLPITNIPLDTLIKEYEVPIKSLLLLIRSLLPIFIKQKTTKIVVVSSMSGVRPYMYGFSHASAKAGLHNAVRSLALELYYRYKSIYVTEILPGIVDTGLYDSKAVVKSVCKIGESFGLIGKRKYSVNNLPLSPPASIAEAILFALQSEAHILSINMVAMGQFPHLGA